MPPVVESIIVYPHRWAAAALLLAAAALVWPAYQWLSAERAQVGAVQRTIDAQAKETRAWLDKSLLPVLSKLEQDANSRTQETVAAVSRTLEDVSGPHGRLEALQGSVSEIGQGLTAVLDKRLAEIGQPAGKLLADLQPTVDQVNTGAKEIPGAIRDARFLLARGARAAGHVEQTLDKIEAAVPEIVADVDKIGANVERATNESAATAVQSRIFMQHLADATKPLPAWARISLAVGPPVVQTGFTVAEWRAIKGK